MTNLEIYSDEFIKSQAAYFGRLAARTRRFEAAVARHEIPRMTTIQWQIVDRCIIVPAPRWKRQMWSKLKEVRP